MAAIFATLMALLKTGDHIVASRNMFGTSIVLLNTIISKFGVSVSFVDLSDLNAWENSINDNTKLFLLETPSNPLGQVVDLLALSKIAKANDILLAVDNAILTPALQKPLELGADIVIDVLLVQYWAMKILSSRCMALCAQPDQALALLMLGSYSKA